MATSHVARFRLLVFIGIVLPLQVEFSRSTGLVERSLATAELNWSCHLVALPLHSYTGQQQAPQLYCDLCRMQESTYRGAKMMVLVLRVFLFVCLCRLDIALVDLVAVTRKFP